VFRTLKDFFGATLNTLNFCCSTYAVIIPQEIIMNTVISQLHLKINYYTSLGL